MILFTVPKPFKGKFAIIQENAINSWLTIKPKPTIILLGNEFGIESFAKSKKIKHINNINKNSNGTPLLDDIFRLIQNSTKERVFMYINSDIILMNSPHTLIDKLNTKFDRFLAIGRRSEMSIKSKISKDEIAHLLKKQTLKQKSNSWMDYFIFSKEVFNYIPPFALGRTFWDKWLVWNAIQNNIPTIDITEGLFAIHQTHSYSLNRKTNTQTIWAGEEALNNLILAKGWSQSATISDATFKLINGDLKPQKKKNISLRPILDYFPLFWPLLLEIRLLRERYSNHA